MADDKTITTEKTVPDSVHQEALRALERAKQDALTANHDAESLRRTVERERKEYERSYEAAKADLKDLCEMAARLVKIVPPDNPLYGQLKTKFAKYGVTF